jgi:hypothetical protein
MKQTIKNPVLQTSGIEFLFKEFQKLLNKNFKIFNFRFETIEIQRFALLPFIPKSKKIFISLKSS